MNKPPDRKQAEALALVAKAALRDNRRSPWLALLLVAGCLGATGYVAWRFMPKSRFPQLMLTAYDVVGLPGQSRQVRAAVAPSDPSESDAHLAGVEIFLQVGSAAWNRQQTGGDGMARLETTLPGAASVEAITARYSGEARKHQPAESRARAYTWPADSQVVLVDVASLFDTGDASFNDRSPVELSAAKDAVATLARMQKQFKIAYWVEGAADPARHARVQSWLEQAWVPIASRLPRGPLLAEGVDDAGRSLVGCFPEQVRGVTKNRDVARAWHGVGIRAILLGGPAEDGIASLESWGKWDSAKQR